MREYIVTVEFWVQSERPIEEVQRRVAEALSERDFSNADVSGWDTVETREV